MSHFLTVGIRKHAPDARETDDIAIHGFGDFGFDRDEQ